ncbi:MAG: ABC transporter ATP-binding protein [Angelakisella sp.]
MDENILEVTGLCKDYGEFKLSNLTLALPRGMVLGLVGANGAGKTTLIKLLLGVIKPTSGTISILGGSPQQSELRDKIGVVFDELSMQEALTPVQCGKIMGGIYKEWDSARYTQLLTQLELPQKQAIKAFSRGMRMKLSLALAMSHHAELLLLDEPTGGLDPIVRTEILDLFREFMQDERHSILLSSHITSDLERIADYIAYLDRGRLLLVEDKDLLLAEYGIVKGKKSELDGLDATALLGLHTEALGFEGLTRHREEMQRRYPELVVDHAALDEIMTFIVREARK